MIISETGKVASHLYMLGYASVPVFLLDGRQPAVFDAGFCYLGNRYAEEIKAVLGRRQPAYCFLSHSHFDHCGAVAVLKRHFPEMRVVASPRAAATLRRPGALSLIDELSRASLEMMRHNDMQADEADAFQAFDVDVEARDGDRFRISSQAVVEILDTPGHTRDCISFYLPQQKTLICSEAAGIADPTGYIVSDCLVDYDMYYASIKKLERLDADVICLGHRYVLTGGDAREYIQCSMNFCRDFKERVETCWQEEMGDMQRVLVRIKAFEYDGKAEPKQPETAYVINLKARIRAVIKHLYGDDIPGGRQVTGNGQDLSGRSCRGRG